jgi:endonuclease YncB( thermonuclease family)
MSQYLNLHGVLFTEPPTGSWYNLSTGRKITKKPKECPDFHLHPSPRVAGTADMIERFLGFQRGNILAGPSSSSEGRSRFALTSLPSYCTSTDVEDLTQEQIDAVPRFTLAGLSTKARVMRTIDGDTLDLLFFVSLEQLLVLKLQESTHGGFFTRWVTRISEYDAAETGTTKGKIAKTMMEKKIAELNNIVYIRVLKFEPHGRVLADVYEDAACTRHIKHFLLDFTHPELGKVAVPNHGEKRIIWPTTPPR